MGELRWIKICFFLMIELHSTVFADRAAALIRSGETMVLSCQCLIIGQTNCNGTTWIYSLNKYSVELVKLGQIDPNLQSKSNKLSLENCSLVIRNVSVEDAGRYQCQQYKSGTKPDHHILVHRSGVDVSVVHITKQKVTDEVTLTCSVKTNGRCEYKVKWLHNCPAGATDVKQCESKQPDCSAAVCFIGQSYMEGCKFKCEVTHGGTRQLFNFSDPSLENKSVETKAETTCSPTREIEGSREPGVPYISTAVVVVIILIGAGVVIGWRTKRNKRRVHYNADQNVNPPASPTGGESSYATLNPEDVHYATIGEAQVAGDEDTVTYSTVGAPSMSVAASSPDNSHAVIYSQVRKVQRKP